MFVIDASLYTPERKLTLLLTVLHTIPFVDTWPEISRIATERDL